MWITTVSELAYESIPRSCHPQTSNFCWYRASHFAGWEIENEGAKTTHEKSRNMLGTMLQFEIIKYGYPNTVWVNTHHRTHQPCWKVRTPDRSPRPSSASPPTCRWLRCACLRRKNTNPKGHGISCTHLTKWTKWRLEMHPHVKKALCSRDQLYLAITYENALALALGQESWAVHFRLDHAEIIAHNA